MSDVELNAIAMAAISLAEHPASAKWLAGSRIGKGSDYFFRAARTFGRAFLAAVLAEAAMAKCSSFLPALSAAASHRGFSPRPAHVSDGFSGLRYFGAIFPPRAPGRPRLR